MNKKGWIVWVWGKVGSLMVFTGMTIVLLTAYSFAGASTQADSANKFSASIRNLIMDTYNSAGGMSFEYEMPKGINGQDYSLELLDKPGDMVGIITHTKSGMREVTGAASVSTPMSSGSFGLVKDYEQELSHICIVKYGGQIYLERSKCS